MRTLPVLGLALLITAAGQSVNAAVVGIYLKPSDLAGNPITQVSLGEEFLLQVFTEDLRSFPLGVYEITFDLFYDSPLVSISGPITAGPNWAGPHWDDNMPGVIDEMRAFYYDPDDPFEPPGGGEFLVFSIPFRADVLGSAAFTGDPSDEQSPLSDILVWGSDDPVPPEDVFYGSASLNIVPEPVSLALWSLAAVFGLAYGWRRRNR